MLVGAGLVLAVKLLVGFEWPAQQPVGTYQGVTMSGQVWVLDTRDGHVYPGKVGEVLP